MKTTFQSIIINYSLLILLSGKQDSNLRPPASKTGKQPPLSFQFYRFTSVFFSGRQPEQKLLMNLCGLCENRTRSAQETVGQVTITSIDLYTENKGIEPSLLFLSAVSHFKPIFAYSPFVTPTGLEPVTLGLENPCSIQLSYGAFLVTPERFELSTPGLKDRCSNHLSYEIVYFGYLRGSNPVLRFHRPALYQIS